MSEIILDWMDFYQAFANRLLDFKNNREELIVKFKKVYVDANIKWSCLEKDFEGNFIDPSDIDPFTVVGVFNRKMTDENRFRIIKVVKEEFSISEEIPTSFAGIPRIRADSPRFYAYEPKGRQEDDIDNLWEVFEAAINYSSNPHNEHYRNEFIKWFDKVKDQKGVGLSNFTTGLFWIRPYTFINLDSRNLKFIADSNLFSDDLVNEVQSIKGFPSGELYLRICEECSLVIEDSDYENLVDFSRHAFLNDIADERDIILKKDFQKVLDEYLDAKEQIGTTRAPIAHYITNDIPQHFNEILDSDKYSCGSSAGKGVLAEIPRIEFGIKNKTNENHVDVAYLFRSDMSGVYLVLRTFHNKNIGKKYGKYLHEHLKTKSIHIQDFIKVYGLKTDAYQESIDLLSNKNTAERYTVSTIYSKFYEKSNIPSDDILENDLLEFLNMYEIVLDNYSDNMYLTVDEWIASLEDENLIDSRMLNVLEIMYNSENHTACYTDIADERHKLGFVDEKHKIKYNAEEKGFKEFFIEKNTIENDILFGRIDLNNEIVKSKDEIKWEYLKGYKDLGLICNLFDDESHSIKIFGENKSNLYNNIKSAIDSSNLINLFEKLKEFGYKIILTSDHGNIYCEGNGIKSNKMLEFEHTSSRCLIFDNEMFADKIVTENPEECFKYQYNILSKDLFLVFAMDGCFDNKAAITHGSISPEECIVPVVILE